LAGVEFNPHRTVLAFFFIVVLEEAADFVRLYAHYGVLLRVEIRTPLVDFDANEVLIELTFLAKKNLFTREFQETPSFRSLGEVFTLKNPLQFTALFIKCQGIGFGRIA
jgi:hypothetical protein